MSITNAMHHFCQGQSIMFRGLAAKLSRVPSAQSAGRIRFSTTSSTGGRADRTLSLSTSSRLPNTCHLSHPCRTFTTSRSHSFFPPSTSNLTATEPSDMSPTKRDDAYRVLTQETMNPAVLQAEYAVRGKIPLRAEELREQLESGEGSDLPFDKVVSCNIGNPQQLDQKPLTYLRQLAALTDYPALIDAPEAASLFPKDVLARAKRTIEEIGSVGAYSHSMGVPAIRKRIAKFIEERDGFPSSPEKIYITAGASGGVANLLQILISSPEDGVLIPIPQYPLYTAALALNSARAVPYYLDESKAWSLDIEDVRHNIQKARDDGTVLKAMVVINPGNPTGSCLSRENMTDIIKICYEEKLVLMADEVYQDNIYLHGQKFVSFKKALHELGAPYADNVELVSFHSISKGQTGECGRRGGYFEICNFLPEAEEQIYKLASIQLCPSLGGQIGVDVLVSPPKEGEESYPRWKEEREGIAKTLKSRSEILHKAFNELEGVSCNDAEGAMYLFPTITIPKRAIEAADESNMAPDAFYALKLLEATGICTVPGSGFGQKEGTFHLRTTFLAPGTDEFSGRLKEFHEAFMKEYQD